MDWADRIGRRVRLRDLHVLLAVAERGSMAKASEHLAISHPVVSKTISDLEHTLGVKLFDRSAQGVELTIYGKALLRCGVNVFDEMRQGLKQIETLADPTTGELRIGSPEIIMAGLLPQIIERFSRQHPRIKLHAVLENAAMLQFQQLRERNIDFLIARTSQLSAADDLATEILFDEPFLAVAGTSSRWARARALRLDQLMGESWILPPYDSVAGSLLLQLFRANNVEPPEPSIATLSVQLTVTLIAGGRFVGLLPRSTAQFNAKRAGLKILPMQLPGARIAAGVITVKNRTLSPLADLFIDCARDVAKSIASAAEARKVKCAENAYFPRFRSPASGAVVRSRV
jgi:DNA-binding transcriptional LysR family regulator